ncbi:MAG: SGNH/GDSL hydrolase family protein [Acidobacteriota bacterium]
MSTRNRLLLRMALVLAGCFLALILVETALRVNGISGGQDRMSVYQFDPELGWTTRKSHRVFRSTGAYGHFSYFNPDGFPTTRELWHTAAGTETPSVAIIGDSFAEGYYLPYESTFPYLLSQRLPDAQVLNLGVGGYSPDQYLLSARRILGHFNVMAIVVTLFSGNDLTFLSSPTMQGYSKPVFGSTLDRPQNTPLVDRRREGAGGGVSDFVESMLDLTATFRVVKPVLGNLGASIGLGRTYRAEPMVHAEAPMTRALGFVKRIQIEFPVDQFMVYFIPLIEELEQPEIYRLNVEVFERVCAQMALRCYAPTPLLEHATPSEIYLPGEGHFSARGSQLVADQVYEILAADHKR